ncbi:MAG: hypothetical protein HYX69_06285 [Planctomycetia bacterium]|nr:hypothetical protein [Planctomycetia bacterium]
MAAIQFACPMCGAVAEVDASLAGAEAACPACQCVLVVPAAPVELPSELPSDSASSSAGRTDLRPKSGKPRLWSRPGGEASSRSKSRTPPPLPESIAQPGIGEPPPEDQAAQPSPATVVDLADISIDAPLYGRAGIGARGRTAGGLGSAEDRAQKRVWANAIMFATAATIVLAALAALVYLTGR